MAPVLLHATFGTRSRRLPRWAVVLPLTVALLLLGAAVYADSNNPPWLGLRLSPDGDGTTISWVQPAGWTWDAGVRPGDRLVQVDGQAPSPTVDLDTARTVEVVSATSGRLLSAPGSETSAPHSPLEQVSFAAIATSFVLLGGLVFIVATEPLAASVMLVFCTAAAMMLVAGVGTARGSTLALSLEFVSLLTFTTSALWLFLAFPTNRLQGRWLRRLALASVALDVALTVGYGASVLAAPLLYELVRPLAALLWTVNLLGATAAIVGSLVAAFRGPTWQAPERQAARRALGTVALGALAGFGPFCGLVLVPMTLGLPAIVPASVAVLSVVLLPLSLGVAVLSRQFLGMDRLVRRGLVSLLVWVALLAIYVAALSRVLDTVTLMSGNNEQLRSTFMLAMVAFNAATFWPLQGWLRRRAERWLFHDVYDFTATMHAFGAELVQLPTAGPIAQHALKRLGTTLGLRWAAIETLEPVNTFHWARRLDSTDGRAALAALEVPLVADGRQIGRVLLGPKEYDVELSVQDEALVVAVAPLLASALQSALLLSRLEEQVALLADREQTLVALSGSLMRVQEEERRRLALELHDDPLQRATLLARRLAGRGLDREQESAEDVAISLRAICYGLRPPMLDDLGLVAALERLVGDMAARSDVQVLLHLSGPEASQRVDPELELALYRVAQEGLNNVLKHAQASQASVTLERGPDWIELRVEDDGCGTETAYHSPRSLGLVGIRERLLPWAGQVAIGRRPQGGGTRLEARVTLDADAVQTPVEWAA